MTSAYVKKTVCPTCGAAKRNPNLHAYVYCDYCASYADFDLSKVLNAAASFDAEQRDAWNDLYQKKQGALAKRNEDLYHELEIQSQRLLIDADPRSCSVRIRDAAYRTALLGYNARYALFTAFDAELAGLFDAAGTAMSGASFVSTGGRTMYSADSAWKYYRAWYEYTARSMLKWNRSEFFLPHPDNTDPRVFLKTSVSAFLQGMSALLPDGVRDGIIQHGGLEHSVFKAKKNSGESRNCGRCGASLTTFPESDNQVCEHCGFMIDLGGAEFECTGCGARLSLPVTEESLKCPYCAALFELAFRPQQHRRYSGSAEEILMQRIDCLYKEK